MDAHPHAQLGFIVDARGLHEELRDPKSHLFDAYFSIRSSLAFATNHGLPKPFAVVSTRPAEGKSSTSLALAQIIGRTGKRVLLVDADLRSPSIHSMVEGSNEVGFSNYLAGENDWSHIVQETSLKNVSIIAAGPVPPSAAELLSGDRLAQFVKDDVTPNYHPVLIRASALFEPGPFFGPTFMRKIGSFCIRAGMPALMQKRASLGFGCQGSCAVGLRYNLSATPHI